MFGLERTLPELRQPDRSRRWFGLVAVQVDEGAVTVRAEKVVRGGN